MIRSPYLQPSSLSITPSRDICMPSTFTNLAESAKRLTTSVGHVTKRRAVGITRLTRKWVHTAVDVVIENPGKTVAIVVATVATGGAAFAAAPVIAAAAGGAGLLGATSAGTAIASLSGAALTNASLAALGGGSIAAGGGGIAAGTSVIAGAGAFFGAGTSTGVVAATSRGRKKRQKNAVPLILDPRK